MNRRFAIGIIGFMMGLNVFQTSAQAWIGEQFELDTMVTLQADLLPEDFSHLSGYVCDSILYYVEMKAFQRKEQKYDAYLYSVSLKDFSQHRYVVPFPSSRPKKEALASLFWIQDLCVSSNRLVVSAQDYILMYDRRGNQFVYDTMLFCPNTKCLYLYNDELYYFEENHDEGYKWFHLHNDGNREFIRELEYEVPHIVQVLPNQYLSHDEHYVYFLSTRYPVLHKYDLSGQWLEDIRFNLPCWHPFEDDYIRKSLTVPYGIERIYATKSEIFQYSYPKVVFPVGDRYLMYYTQFDSMTNMSSLHYAVHDSEQKTSVFTCKDTTDAQYAHGRFPFNLFTLEDKLHFSYGDWLVELTAECDEPWQNLAPQVYETKKERFFKQNDPVYKIRIMRNKNNSPESVSFFYDEEGRLLLLDDLPEKKNVLLVSGPLDCSACKVALLEKLNALSAEAVNVGILFPFVLGALQEREMKNQFKQYLGRTFRFYYLAVDRYAEYPRYIFPSSTTYPAILLKESGKAPILYNVDQIFDDDFYPMQFRKSFLKTWNAFAGKR